MNNNLRQISRAYIREDYSEEQLANLTPDILKEEVTNKFIELYEKKEAEIGKDIMRDLERMILLRVIDNKWMDHIDAMDQLRHGIGLRAIGQQDPASAYAQEGFDMFELMTESIKEDTVKFCYNVSVETKTERKQVISGGKEVKDDTADAYIGGGSGDMPAQTDVPAREQKKEPVRRAEAKIGRNDPCPCGSGKKYKNCCGKNA
jgi:preprotein translocase subunit SecA